MPVRGLAVGRAIIGDLDRSRASTRASFRPPQMGPRCGIDADAIAGKGGRAPLAGKRTSARQDLSRPALCWNALARLSWTHERNHRSLIGRVTNAKQSQGHAREPAAAAGCDGRRRQLDGRAGNLDGTRSARREVRAAAWAALY